MKSEAASTRLCSRCGALRRAKGPNCKAASLPDPHARRKTGAPTGPRRAVERSIYRTLAPLAPGTHEPVSQEGGQPNVQSEACATRLSTVRRARHREAAPRDAVAAPARSLARDPAQKGSQTSAGKWAAATTQPSHETTAHETTHRKRGCRSSRTSRRSRPSASTRARATRAGPRSRTTTTIGCIVIIH